MILVMKEAWDSNEQGYGDTRQVGSFPVSVDGLLDAMACMAYEDDSDSVVFIELFGEIMPMMPSDRLNEKMARRELQKSPAYQAFVLRKREIAALVSVTGPARSVSARAMAI